MAAVDVIEIHTAPGLVLTRVKYSVNKLPIVEKEHVSVRFKAQNFTDWGKI